VFLSKYAKYMTKQQNWPKTLLNSQNIKIGSKTAKSLENRKNELKHEKVLKIP